MTVGGQSVGEGVGRRLAGASISLRNVEKVHSAVQALASLSTELRPGQAVGIVDPRGCGNRPLMRLIAGLELPTCGESAAG